MKIVESYPSGEPLDPQWTKYHRYFNGVELVVFDDFSEYATYFNLVPEESDDPNESSNYEDVT